MIEQNFEGAGFLLINPKLNLLLALIDNNGFYDYPKGVKDKGESPIKTARRECFEECGIKILDREIIGPGTKIGTLMLYPAFTSSDPIIMPNPKSGIIEHSGWEWLDSIDLINNCQLWLREIIIACLESIEK